jgi:hypothetical protein
VSRHDGQQSLTKGDGPMTEPTKLDIFTDYV